MERRIAEAASALFAAPGPGDRLRGRLLWQGLGCGDERPSHGEGAHEPGRLLMFFNPTADITSQCIWEERFISSGVGDALFLRRWPGRFGKVWDRHLGNPRRRDVLGPRKSSNASRAVVPAGVCAGE